MELSEPRPAPTPLPALGRRLVAFNLLMLVLVAALVWISQSASRRNHTERAEVATENIAAGLAQTILAELDRVDIGLRNVALDLEPDFSAGSPDAARVEALLAQQLALLPQLESIRIADAQGVVRYGRGVAEAPRVDVSDREYFVQAREGRSPGPVVSGPMQARISQQWVVAVARPLRDAGGDFVGVVYANVAAERFARLIEGVDLGRGGAVTLRGSGLAVLARRSVGSTSPVETGSSMVSAELKARLAAQLTLAVSRPMRHSTAWSALPPTGASARRRSWWSPGWRPTTFSMHGGCRRAR
ncbi:hypothetical protein FSC37_16890 [Piscinibacter aquaticus]|uniref:Cache domain-containing protein n=1 Tax=Piscinibacter aquaticus TaxID=392597 RepID=A0A5C6U549_9BURK|nr:hypothetical protein FSC37_16890 [Piscinibacter aquaticus]